MGTDTSTEHYYGADGRIVAVVRTSISGHSCSGPADFVAPVCTSDGTRLAVCPTAP